MYKELTTDKHRGNNLDLLRLLFASMVLLAHAPEVRDGNRERELLSQLTGGIQSFGDFAVNGFFVLSGYLIMASWRRSPQPGIYLKNRFLRIYPGFIIAFCISVLIVGPIAAPDFLGYFHQFTLTRFLFSLFTLREPWFAHSAFGSGSTDVNSSLWTISYEFTCYLTLLFIAVVARQNLRRLWFALTVSLLLAACFLPELEGLPQINRFRITALITSGLMFFMGGSLLLLGFQDFRRSHFSGWLGGGLTLMTGVMLFLSMFSLKFHVIGFALFGSIFSYPSALTTKSCQLLESGQTFLMALIFMAGRFCNCLYGLGQNLI